MKILWLNLKALSDETMTWHFNASRKQDFTPLTPACLNRLQCFPPNIRNALRVLNTVNRVATEALNQALDAITLQTKVVMGKDPAGISLADALVQMGKHLQDAGNYITIALEVGRHPNDADRTPRIRLAFTRMEARSGSMSQAAGAPLYIYLPLLFCGVTQTPQ